MKHNSVYLYGVVKTEPYKMKLENENHLACKIEVVRGNRYYGDTNKSKKDILPVIAFNEKNIEEMSQWHENDIVGIKGYISVATAVYNPKCSHCKEENEQKIQFTFVCPIYCEKRVEQPSEDEIRELMNSHREISNQITIGGHLITPPQFYRSKKEVDTAVFDIKTDVKYNFESAEKEYYTFPIKSYGFNAKMANSLQKEDPIFIDGFISGKNNHHNCTCTSCMKSFNWSNNGIEITALSLEFFN